MLSKAGLQLAQRGPISPQPVPAAQPIIGALGVDLTAYFDGLNLNGHHDGVQMEAGLAVVVNGAYHIGAVPTTRWLRAGRVAPGLGVLRRRSTWLAWLPTLLIVLSLATLRIA